MFDTDVIAVKVKPNAKNTSYEGYNHARQRHIFSVSAPADNGKANTELIAYIKKTYSLQAEIFVGRTSQNKLVRLTPLLQKNL